MALEKHETDEPAQEGGNTRPMEIGSVAGVELRQLFPPSVGSRFVPSGSVSLSVAPWSASPALLVCVPRLPTIARFAHLQCRAQNKPYPS